MKVMVRPRVGSTYFGKSEPWFWVFPRCGALLSVAEPGGKWEKYIASEVVGLRRLPIGDTADCQSALRRYQAQLS
jgi:hypothetical protein